MLLFLDITLIYIYGCDFMTNADEIMIVDKKVLFDKTIGMDLFEGFKSSIYDDYSKVIRRNFTYAKPDSLPDESKQIILYCSIVNLNNQTVFLYRKNEDTKDNHSIGNYSVGISGPVKNVSDKSYDIAENIKQIIDKNVLIKGTVRPIHLGYINQENNPLFNNNFGLSYVLLTNAEKIELIDEEASGRMVSFREIGRAHV